MIINRAQFYQDSHPKVTLLEVLVLSGQSLQFVVFMAQCLDKLVSLSTS